jgi:hypothetical protein
MLTPGQGSDREKVCGRMNINKMTTKARVSVVKLRQSCEAITRCYQNDDCLVIGVCLMPDQIPDEWLLETSDVFR